MGGLVRSKRMRSARCPIRPVRRRKRHRAGGMDAPLRPTPLGWANWATGMASLGRRWCESSKGPSNVHERKRKKRQNRGNKVKQTMPSTRSRMEFPNPPVGAYFSVLPAFHHDNMLCEFLSHIIYQVLLLAIFGFHMSPLTLDGRLRATMGKSNATLSHQWWLNPALQPLICSLLTNDNCRSWGWLVGVDS